MTETIRDTDNENSSKIRLYLDLDGVIFPVHRLDDNMPDNPDIDKLHNLEWWRKSVVNKIGQMGVEVVMSSSWGQAFMNSVIKSPKESLSPSRSLNTQTTSKKEVVLNDLNSDLTPFIWIDDDLTQPMIDYVNDGLIERTPGLFVKPDRQQGLTMEELNAIEYGFLNQLHSSI